QDPSLAGQPLIGEGGPAPEDAAGATDDESAPELEPTDNFERSGRRRRGRGGRGPDREGPRPEGRAPERREERPPLPLAAAAGSAETAATLDNLLSATALLLRPTKKAPFLGTGTFGGPWSANR